MELRTGVRDETEIELVLFACGAAPPRLGCPCTSRGYDCGVGSMID